MSEYTDEQIEYALTVLVENGGDAEATEKVLDARFAQEQIDFSVARRTLVKWRRTEHAAMFRRLSTEYRERHTDTVFRRVQDAVNKAAQGLEDAVERATDDMERQSGRDAALVADKLSQVAERGTKLMASIDSDSPDESARIMDDAMAAIQRNVDEGWLAVAKPIAEALEQR